jgi:hypothetical protein
MALYPGKTVRPTQRWGRGGVALHIACEARFRSKMVFAFQAVVKKEGSNPYFQIIGKKWNRSTWAWCLIPVIPVTWEVETGRLIIQGEFRERVSETLVDQ